MTRRYSPLSLSLISTQLTPHFKLGRPPPLCSLWNTWLKFQPGAGPPPRVQCSGRISPGKDNIILLTTDPPPLPPILFEENRITLPFPLTPHLTPCHCVPLATFFNIIITYSISAAARLSTLAPLPAPSLLLGVLLPGAHVACPLPSPRGQSSCGSSSWSSFQTRQARIQIVFCPYCISHLIYYYCQFYLIIHHHSILIFVYFKCIF